MFVASIDQAFGTSTLSCTKITLPLSSVIEAFRQVLLIPS